jgi:hypothetical protein
LRARAPTARAEFDQQPIEACPILTASLGAARVTGQRVWCDEARRAFARFLGQTQKQLALYDPTTGACRDRLPRLSFPLERLLRRLLPARVSSVRSAFVA